MDKSIFLQYYNKYCKKDNKAMKLKLRSGNYIIESEDEVEDIGSSVVKVNKKEETIDEDVYVFFTVIDLSTVEWFSIIPNETERINRRRKIFEKYTLS